MSDMGIFRTTLRRDVGYHPVASAGVVRTICA